MLTGSCFQEEINEHSVNEDRDDVEDDFQQDGGDDINFDGAGVDVDSEEEDMPMEEGPVRVFCYFSTLGNVESVQIL